MGFRATIVPSQHTFLVESNETILESALRSGLALNYGCSNGNCGLCRARLVSGRTEAVRHYDYVIREAAKAQGYVLLCSHTATSDIVLEAGEAKGPADIPYQDITGKLKERQYLTNEINLLRIRTPRTNVCVFSPVSVPP